MNANAAALPGLGGYVDDYPDIAGEIGERMKDMVKGGLISLATVLTNVGVSIITNRMIQAGTAPKYIGMGTGTTTAAVSQTALVTEVETRATGTESRTTVTQTNDNYQTQGTITATATRAVTEAGTFDATSVGNMMIRGDFSAVNLATNDSIQFTVGTKFVPG